MSILPVKLHKVLEDDIYNHEDKGEVDEKLLNLDVEVSDTFREFYYRYAGPFWEEHVPYELLDLVDDDINIESNTLIVREEHKFPSKYLVLSEMSANAIIVLDSVTDKVYSVNFEGEDELLIKGELKENWTTFYDFLKEYFNC